MMEDKLYRAAAELPEPMLTFDMISRKPVRNRRRVAVLAVVICLLVTACACIRTSTSYGLWRGMSSNSIWDLKNWTGKVGYELPETLWDCTFVDITKLHGAPTDASWLEAMVAPTSAYISVDYQSDNTGEAGSYKCVDVSVISTNDASWRWHFSMDEDNIFSHPDIREGSYAAEEYGGMTLQTAWIGNIGYVTWVDEVKEVCVRIYASHVSGVEGTCDMEAAVALAKELIDQNQQENRR